MSVQESSRHPGRPDNTMWPTHFRSFTVTVWVHPTRQQCPQVRAGEFGLMESLPQPMSVPEPAPNRPADHTVHSPAAGEANGFPAWCDRLPT